MFESQNKGMQAKARLQKLENMVAPTKIKVLLVQSFLAQLRNQSQNMVYKENEKSLISDTFFTDSPSQCAIRDLEDLQMESKILGKRQLKIELNEEIQLLEDDLFQQDKIVETKRQLNEELDKQINKLHHQINIQAYKNSTHTPRELKRTIKKTNSVSSLFKKMFN